MRQNVLLLAAFIVLVGGWATTGGAGEPVDTAALGHVLEQWAVTWSSGDVNQLLPLFTDDVLYPTFKGCLQPIDILGQFSELRADVSEEYLGKSNSCVATP
jgi:hypothetical protein